MFLSLIPLTDIIFSANTDTVCICDIFSVCRISPALLILRKFAFEGAAVYAHPFFLDYIVPWGECTHKTPDYLLIRDRKPLTYYIFLNISVCRSTILFACFFIMTVLTKALPVAFIPKQFIVTSVRFDMVNHRSLNVFSVPLTNLTQRMFSKICLT